MESRGGRRHGAECYRAGTVGSRRSGLSETVHDTGMCSMCWFGLFFSHRRDGGRSGRQAGLVWLLGGTDGGVSSAEESR